MKRRSKHNIFISYYHKDDQKYKDALVSVKIKAKNSSDIESIYGQDRSVKQNSIKDEGLDDNQIRSAIRKKYIKDSEVLILLCGKNTKKRKFVDWEIHAAMYSNNNDKKLGILVINLPDTSKNKLASSKEESCVLHTNYNKNKNKKEIINKFSYLPRRILDNIVKNDVKITIVNWEDVYEKPKKLMYLIDNAYKNSKINNYDTHKELKRKND